jgi:hypothetical protein
MRQLPLLLSILLCLSPAASHARLGETVQGFTERFGPPVERRPAVLEQSDPEALVFSKSGITIIAEFRQGAAWSVRYRSVELSADQAKQLLRFNMAEGGGWSAAYEVAGVYYRMSADRGSVAVYDPGRHGEMGFLQVSSREFAAAWRNIYGPRVEAAVQAPVIPAAAATLEGF